MPARKKQSAADGKNLSRIRRTIKRKSQCCEKAQKSPKLQRTIRKLEQCKQRQNISKNTVAVNNAGNAGLMANAIAANQARQLPKVVPFAKARGRSYGGGRARGRAKDQAVSNSIGRNRKAAQSRYCCEQCSSTLPYAALNLLLNAAESSDESSDTASYQCSWTKQWAYFNAESAYRYQLDNFLHSESDSQSSESSSDAVSSKATADQQTSTSNLCNNLLEFTRSTQTTLIENESENVTSSNSSLDVESIDVSENTIGATAHVHNLEEVGQIVANVLATVMGRYTRAFIASNGNAMINITDYRAGGDNQLNQPSVNAQNRLNIELDLEINENDEAHDEDEGNNNVANE